METSTQTKAATKAEAPTNGPVKVIRIEDASVSIFARDREVKGETVTFHSVSFSRSYKDATGKWRYSQYFDFEDLGKVMLLAKEASDYIQSARGMVAVTGED